jgi:Putative adhesin
MKIQLTVAVALVAATCPLLAQPKVEDDAYWLQECRDHGNWNEHARYCEIRVEHVTNARGPIDVDARENGGVELIGRTASDIVVHELVETEASSEADAKDLASQVRVVIDAGRIHADGPESRHRHSWTVSYRIEVPHQIDVTAESINGPLEASDVAGNLELRTQNGPIELTSVGGNVHARTQNGPVEVTLTGSRWNGQGLDAETENGPVELTLPSNYAAHLETGTVNGPMSVSFPITVQGHIDIKRLSMDIGGGGPTVRVVTTNGPVTVDH